MPTTSRTIAGYLLAWLVQGPGRDLPEFAAGDVAILANEHDPTVLVARDDANRTRMAHDFSGRGISVRQTHPVLEHLKQFSVVDGLTLDAFFHQILLSRTIMAA